MRKILLLLAAAGMWTMYDLDSTVYNIMVAEGFQLPYENLYSSPNAIKNCVVNFSGYCTGVVVSPNGLVFTNHHCGFSAINKHSTVEHDYMRNGFYAKSYAEELPNENMFVSFMKEQKDITARVESLIQGKGMAEQESIIDSLTNVLTDSVKQKDERQDTARHYRCFLRRKQVLRHHLSGLPRPQTGVHSAQVDG